VNNKKDKWINLARLTEIVEKDIDAVAALYALDITHFKAIHGGDENSSFLLSGDDQDHVLTFYEKRSLEGAETLAESLNYLARHGFYTNRAVSTLDGRFALEYKGKPILLKTWITGETLRDTEQSDFRSIGRSMADLHAVPAPGFLPKDHPHGLTIMPRSCGYGIDRDYEKWLADKIAYLERNYPADLPKAFIHSDLFDDNIIYNQGKFQAIIDFGDACHYTRAYDLGSVLFGACMVDGRLDLERANGVLDGYLSRMRLEAGEKEAVQFFAVYAGAAISAWHYLHTYLGDPGGDKLDKYRLAAARTEHLFRLEPGVFDSLQ
jgi:homoserine kinase type II